MKAALKKAVAGIQEAGFSHIKVELEAHLERRSGGACLACNGGRQATCTDCNGRGYVSPAHRNLLEDHAECETCQGTGRMNCTACDGSGRGLDFSNNNTCLKFILDYVSKAVQGTPYTQRVSNEAVISPEQLPGLTYARFYYDGSVDSELTFTVPITKVELVVEFIKGFKALSKANGRGMNVAGAGMHIGILLRQSNGVYPHSSRMDSRKLENFTREVTKLLPALFFCASSNHQSRRLGARMPQISSGKYNAISTHNGHMLEYRVFETCYDRPEAFFEFVQVIANTLRFYSNPRLHIKELGKEFEFPDGSQVQRFFSTTDQLRVINATVKHLKPEDKSYKQMRAERGIKGTVSELVRVEKVTIQALKQDYKQHKEHYDRIIKAPLTGAEQIRVDNLVLDGCGYDEAIAIVRGIKGLEPLDDFIKKNVKRKAKAQATVSV